MNYDFTALEKKLTIPEEVLLVRSSDPTRFRGALLFAVATSVALGACMIHAFIVSSSLLGKIIITVVGLILIPSIPRGLLHELAESCQIKHFVQANPEIIKLQGTEPLFDGMNLGKIPELHQNGNKRVSKCMRVGNSELALYGVFRIAGRRIIVNDVDLRQFEEYGAKYIKKDGWTFVYWQAGDMSLAEKYRQWFEIADALNDI